MKRLLPALLAATCLIGIPAVAQNVPDIAFDSAANALTTPDDIYLGEVSGVAMDSKGNIYVYNRTGHPTITLGGANETYAGFTNNQVITASQTGTAPTPRAAPPKAARPRAARPRRSGRASAALTRSTACAGRRRPLRFHRAAAAPSRSNRGSGFTRNSTYKSPGLACRRKDAGSGGSKT